MDFEDLVEADEEIAEKLDLVLTWAETNPDFDTEFVESLAEQFEESGSLSEKQVEALDNIIARFEIE